MGVVLVLDRLGTDLELTGEPVLLVSSALAGSLTLAGVLLPARRTLLRRAADRARPVTSVLVLVTAAGAATVVGGIHDAAVGLPADPSIAHLLERTGWTAAFLVILTIAADALTEHRTQFAQLATRAALLEHTRAEVGRLRETAVASEIARIAAEVRAELAALDGDDLPEALARLRHTGENVVRSMSHELAQASSPYQPSAPPPKQMRLSLSAMISDATADRPLRPAVATVVLALWGTASTVDSVGFLRALEVGLAVGAITVLSIGVVGSLAHRMLRGRPPRSRIAIVGMATLAAALVWAGASRTAIITLGIPLPAGDGVVRLAAQALLLTAFPIAQGLGRAARRQGAHAVEELQAMTDAVELEVARANAELWQRRRALSRALHGPIQAAINASSLRLARRGRDGALPDFTIANAQVTIEAALASLERQFASGRLDTGDDLDLAVSRIRGLWEGIAEIDVELPEEVANKITGDRTITAVLVDVLTEACSNAVRHGRARRINARLQGDAERIVLEVIDDGRVETIGAPGGGSALLDEVALAWQRTHGTEGTRLIASFARP
jgi:signal transduction histidine kinase